MKVFWGIVAALVVLTLVLMLGRGGGRPPAGAMSEPAAGVAPMTAPLQFDAPPVAAAPAVPETVQVPEPSPPPDATEVSGSQPGASADRRSSLDVLGDLDRAISEMTGSPIQPAPVVDPPATAVTRADPSAGARAPATPATTADGQPAPVKLEAVEDGWTRVDDRFMIRGQGSAEDPYIIPWDILVSASETYRPRLGKRVLPERVTMLAGKHVRITGFLLFPMFTSSADELLIMRNQWDGCCIGIPPTPYDAVEVKVTQAVERRDMFVQYATVEGVLKVEPYVNRDWLLGLYVIENARVLKMSDEGVERPPHPPGGHPGSEP